MRVKYFNLPTWMSDWSDKIRSTLALLCNQFIPIYSIYPIYPIYPNLSLVCRRQVSAPGRALLWCLWPRLTYVRFINGPDLASESYSLPKARAAHVPDIDRHGCIKFREASEEEEEEEENPASCPLRQCISIKRKMPNKMINWSIGHSSLPE